jgi:protein-S-isoprenylcysteine O-methyltransferase Ste14
VDKWSAIARRIRVPMGFVLALFYVWIARPTWTSIAIGTLIAIPGILLRALASGHVKKNEELTTSGPYAYTRNPLYLGSFIMAVGFAVAARSGWVLLMMVLMFLVIYVPVIRSEEAFLRQKFSSFEEYARRVPRLLPRPTPDEAGATAFDRKLYWQHREYNAVLGTAAVIAILMAKLVWRRH